jgi:hypothetical protein
VSDDCANKKNRTILQHVMLGYLRRPLQNFAVNIDTKILSDWCYALVWQKLWISTELNNNTHPARLPAVPSTFMTLVEQVFPLHILQSLSLTPILCQKAGHED